ncbi:DUF1992 domain-containing protein [bacterium]|nr:DUF1992 domain-containing protein [bacterium]
MKHAFEKIAEARIKEALEKGQLDGLPGQGAPIDLSDYFASPPHLRMAFQLLRDSGFTPHEVELLREIHELKEKRGSAKDKQMISDLTERINSKNTQLNILLERNRLPRSS